MDPDYLDDPDDFDDEPPPRAWWDPPPMPPADPPPPLILRGTLLRYALIRLLQLNSPSTIPELVAGLQTWGFAVEGRPSKTVSDALRWELRRGRVEQRGRGSYIAGDVARSTEYRIIRRVEELRDDAQRDPTMRGPAARRRPPRDHPVCGQPMSGPATPTEPPPLSLEGGHGGALSLRGGHWDWGSPTEANAAKEPKGDDDNRGAPGTPVTPRD